MKILSLSSELAPLCQSGGLGDAVSGLARALGQRGHHVICALPAYRQALRHAACPPLSVAGHVRIDMRFENANGAYGINIVDGQWLAGEMFQGVSLRLLDVPRFYDRAGLYGENGQAYHDEPERFIAFARAAAYLAETEKPDVILAHDWHSALAICILRTALDRGSNREIAAVQVVHNNAYQGRCGAHLVKMAGLAPDLLHPDGLEAWNDLCLLKGGILWADRVVAVSPRYAEEIRDDRCGEGLDGAYRSRGSRLSGIANGIDTVRFDPATDPHIARNFSATNLDGKAACRSALLQSLGLEVPPDGLLLAAVGRFVEQKGWDVIAHSVEPLVEQKQASIILLGDGDPHLASWIRHLAHRYPRRVAALIRYDEALSRQIYAGADAILVPSRFEPCGLVQLLAQRYGTVPLAHAVGGLVDTIRDPIWRNEAVPEGRDAYDAAWDQATGVLYQPLNPDSLLYAAERMAALGRTGRLAEVQKRLLELDVSWNDEKRVGAWEHIFATAMHDVKQRW